LVEQLGSISNESRVVAKCQGMFNMESAGLYLFSHCSNIAGCFRMAIHNHLGFACCMGQYNNSASDSGRNFVDMAGMFTFPLRIINFLISTQLDTYYLRLDSCGHPKFKRDDQTSP
jgi:hypothetical protein